jgi:alpha-N-arabinofuranosidase
VGLGHHYSWNVSRGATTDWDAGKGDALAFTTDEWYEMLAQADLMESLITGHWAVMGEIDRRHRVKLVVDEWGTWHKPGSEVHPSHHLGQQSSMRDALVAGLTLDIFHRHADKVVMANVAQLVNCLQSLFLTDGARLLTTPTYHVFAMYAPHAGAQSVRTQVSAPRISYARVREQGSVVGLAGSASRSDRVVTLTVVNTHATEPSVATIAIRGGRAASARAVALSAPDIHAHNTFDRPSDVAPTVETPIAVDGGAIVHRFAPASVTRLAITCREGTVGSRASGLGIRV